MLKQVQHDIREINVVTLNWFQGLLFLVILEYFEAKLCKDLIYKEISRRNDFDSYRSSMTGAKLVSSPCPDSLGVSGPDLLINKMLKQVQHDGIYTSIVTLNLFQGLMFE